MTDDHLCSLLERLAGVRRDLVERLMAATGRKPVYDWGCRFRDVVEHHALLR